MGLLREIPDSDTLHKMEEGLKSSHKMKSMTNTLSSGIVYILTLGRGVDEHGNIRPRKNKKEKNLD